MSILQSIRKRNGLLIGFVAVALLLFLLGGIDWRRFGKKDPNIFGKVNGTVITKTEYYSNYNLLRTQYGDLVPEKTLEQENWKSLIQNKLIENKFDLSGFKLTNKMVWNGAINTPLANNPQFKNKQGKFDPSLIEDVMIEAGANSVKNSEYLQYYNYLLDIMRGLETQAKIKQYLGSLKPSILINSLELKNLSSETSSLATVDFLRIDFDKYNENAKISLTQEDIQNYINKHKNQFKIEANRTIDYVYFSANPSEFDILKTKYSLINLSNGTIIDGDTIKSFKSIKNDSLYINNLSDAQYLDKPFNGKFQYLSQLPKNIKNWVLKASPGEISPVFQNHNSFTVSKFLTKKKDRFFKI